MLINNWYVAAPSSELGDTPKGAKMLGQDFVLFRDQNGKACCLSNVCIHRGGSLCHGKLEDGAMLCPYHGWRFNADGQCVDIPSLKDGTKIPKRARVDSYPVEEQWGWVWVFLGDLSEKERPKLPGRDLFPEWYAREGGSEEYAFVHGTFLFEANWMRAIDNVLDPAHGFHVHTDFGNLDDQVVRPFNVERPDDETILSKHSFAPVNKRGKWREKIDDVREDTDNQVQLRWPGLIFRNDIFPRAGMHHFVISGYLPIDEHHTLNTFIHARNFFTEEKNNADTLQRNLNVFSEDAAVLKNVRPYRSPMRLASELMIEPDKHTVAFREMVKRYEAKGWRINSRAAGDQEDEIFAIPSPARRKDPKNWVFGTVPLVNEAMAKAAE